MKKKIFFSFFAVLLILACFFTLSICCAAAADNNQPADPSEGETDNNDTPPDRAVSPDHPVEKFQNYESVDCISWQFSDEIDSLRIELVSLAFSSSTNVVFSDTVDGLEDTYNSAVSNAAFYAVYNNTTDQISVYRNNTTTAAHTFSGNTLYFSVPNVDLKSESVTVYRSPAKFTVAVGVSKNNYESVIETVGTYFESMMIWFGETVETIVSEPILFIFLVGLPVTAAIIGFTLRLVKRRR